MVGVSRLVAVLLLIAGLGQIPAMTTAGPAATQPAGPSTECLVHPDVTATATEAVPAALTRLIDRRLAHPDLAEGTVAVSVWIDGFGEVAARLPNRRLRPASAQKILTAITALEVLGPDRRLATTVVATGPVVDGVITGNLYLVGGGDPTLTRSGDHSLRALAALVRVRGITGITGGVVVDESRYDSRRNADGWDLDFYPDSVGSLSALVADRNDYRNDVPFYVSPALHNGRLFGQMLAAAGVTVGFAPVLGVAPPDATVVAELRSPPVSELVTEILTDSDNTVSELLIKEVGLVAAGRGSTGMGIKAAEEVSGSLCMRPSAEQADGSGLSDLNRRSARDWRSLLQAAQSRSWYPLLLDGLAIAGETGTLQNRFLGTPAEGNLRAKTGTLEGLSSLSGVMTTAAGRRVFFSVIIDADAPFPKLALIDAMLADIAADTS
ncbi:MAG: D-alanyl-D-alanine carboxypeptidase/D-alanyl-D-alanine-endopeptidase [Acidimicrobiia bacterium]|nr:D-alanyl-D-alanine carboxypeptidase/D-alanyl-D-alanine-endopeptidase [Acidimicrobiia bacterium]